MDIPEEIEPYVFYDEQAFKLKLKSNAPASIKPKFDKFIESISDNKIDYPE